MSALRKVLVVDDDAVVGKSFDRVLTKDKGYVVITAQSGSEALEKMRTQKYDLVFTDIKMPGMDGVELAEQVKASQSWTPIVIITGFGTTENEVRAKAAGVTEFMRKPLSPAMIEESAAHALLETESISVSTLAPVAVQEVHIELEQEQSSLKNVALFVAAPFIGLAYAVSLPLVGLAMLAWIGGKALIQTKAAKYAPTYLKNVALLLAAPFIGLAYAVALPFVGVAMLTWTAGKTLLTQPEVKRTLPLIGSAGKLLAAPFIGLAYAVLLPLIGTVMLVWVGGKAFMSSTQTA
jgi:CheY-like chemotaxis protein